MEPRAQAPLCLRSGAGFGPRSAGFSNVLVVDRDHDPKFNSEVFHAFVKSMGSCLIVGSAYRDHKNTNAKVERTNGVISDTLRVYANGRKDNWDVHLLPAEFAIDNAASTLGDGLTPFFIDRGRHSQLPLSPPRDDCATSETSEHYARRMHEIEATVRDSAAGAAGGGAGGAQGEARHGPGRHGIRSGGCYGPKGCSTPPT
jgi:hypothetical protein